MGIFRQLALVAVIGFHVVHATSDEVCPKPWDLAPCTCNEEGINCMNAIDEDDIKNSLSSPGEKEHVALYIQKTGIKNLPLDILGDFRFKTIYIELNTLLTSVDLDVFARTKNSLTALSLYRNQISKFTFEKLSSFPILGALILGKNNLKTIPSHAFNCPKISNLDLSNNPIESIGYCAFCELPNLSKLLLYNTKLTTLGPRSVSINSMNNQGMLVSLDAGPISKISKDAFEKTTFSMLSLTQNKLTFLSREVFQTIANSDATILVSGNPLTCKGCEYGWIVDDKQFLLDKFPDFMCASGGGIVNLTRQSIGC